MGLLNGRKGKGGEVELAAGVGNPVYDSFNEGQPLDEVSDVKANEYISPIYVRTLNTSLGLLKDIR